MSPLHHHFELTGWRENRVVGVFSLVTLICSIIGFKKSKELNNGKGFSIAGIIISSIKIALGILVTVLLIIAYYVGDNIVVENSNNNKVKNEDKIPNTNVIENEEQEKKNDETVDCNITSIKGTNISLKNKKNDNGRITTDVYINNNYSTNVYYYTSPYNNCESIDIEEIDNDYFLIKFANEAAMYTNFYLFNKNGKFITDFKDWYKKYNSNLDYLLWVGKNENGGLAVNYYSDWFETSIDNAYCEAKAKPDDNYSIEEKVNIVNDELKTDSIKKTTWKEQYMCKDGNTADCGNIEDVVCE